VQWTQGTLSHLVVEAAGLDIAQGLGLLLRGDDALKVDCGAADLRVRDGRVTPQVFLVDTRDSTLWLTGGLSLADERLQLVAHVQPKDFSPLTLRTPLHIDGTLAAPVLSLEKGPLLRRVVPAVLLAMINPLAALIPLLDPGQTDAPGVAGCQALATRARATAPP
jgi:AsmA family protein